MPPTDPTIQSPCVTDCCTADRAFTVTVKGPAVADGETPFVAVTE